jgi:hypothetical protein
MASSIGELPVAIVSRVINIESEVRVKMHVHCKTSRSRKLLMLNEAIRTKTKLETRGARHRRRSAFVPIRLRSGPITTSPSRLMLSAVAGLQIRSRAVLRAIFKPNPGSAILEAPNTSTNVAIQSSPTTTWQRSVGTNNKAMLSVPSRRRAQSADRSSTQRTEDRRDLP